MILCDGFNSILQDGGKVALAGTDKGEVHGFGLHRPKGVDETGSGFSSLQRVTRRKMLGRRGRVVITLLASDRDIEGFMPSYSFGSKIELWGVKTEYSTFLHDCMIAIEDHDRAIHHQSLPRRCSCQDVRSRPSSQHRHELLFLKRLLVSL